MNCKPNTTLDLDEVELYLLEEKATSNLLFGFTNRDLEAVLSSSPTELHLVGDILPDSTFQILSENSGRLSNLSINGSLMSFIQDDFKFLSKIKSLVSLELRMYDFELVDFMLLSAIPGLKIKVFCDVKGVFTIGESESAMPFNIDNFPIDPQDETFHFSGFEK